MTWGKDTTGIQGVRGQRGHCRIELLQCNLPQQGITWAKRSVVSRLKRPDIGLTNQAIFYLPRTQDLSPTELLGVDLQQLRKQALSALRTLLSLGATLWTYPPQGEASDSYLQSVTGAKHRNRHRNRSLNVGFWV